MPIKAHVFTNLQSGYVWVQTADSTSLVDSTTETSFDQSPEFDLVSDPFVAGETLEYYFAGVLSSDSTPTITLALFWGTEAGTLLVRTPAITLTASGGNGFIASGLIHFRSATTAVASINAAVKTAAATIANGADVSAAITIAQTSAAQRISLAIDWSAAGFAGTALTRIGRMGLMKYGV